MARDGAIYVCQSCGAVHGKWSGQCGACGEWNTLVEESRSRPARRAEAASKARGRGPGVRDPGVRHARAAPHRTGVDEFDRVCGGGVVPGSAILLGGDPGVGKSTLLLQVAAKAALARRARAPTSPARRRSSRSAPAPSAWAWPTRR